MEESGNFTSALETAIEMQDSEVSLSLCIAACENLLSLAGPERSLSLLRSALAIPCENTGLRVKTLGVASFIAGQDRILKTAPFGNAYIMAYALWNLPEPLCQIGNTNPEQD